MNSIPPTPEREPGQVAYPDVSVRLIGEDGNVFNLMGLVAGALRAVGHEAAAREFVDAATAARSYDEVLGLIMRTVNVI